MSSRYLIDFENVHEAGLKGMDSLAADDSVYIFHTSPNDRITLKSLDHVQAWVKVIIVPPGKQSLDMHLGSFLGYLIGQEESRDTQYAIVSKDNDYNNIIEFWNRSFQTYNKVRRIHSMSLAWNASADLVPDPEPFVCKDEHSHLHAFIINTMKTYGVIGMNGLSGMLVSDLCCHLKNIPEYTNARKQSGKKAIQFFADEYPDILLVQRKWDQDWIYLLDKENASTDKPVNDSESETDHDDSAVVQADDLIIDDVCDLPQDLSLDESDKPEPIPEIIENIPIDQMNASVRTRNALRRAGYTMSDEILHFSDGELLKIRNLGKKGVTEIRSWIESQQQTKETLPAVPPPSAEAESTQTLPDNTIDESKQATTAECRRKFYEEAFSNIFNQLSVAGLETDDAKEIAELYMKSNTTLEPRKVIHTLLCQRFGNKEGAQYYRKALKYIGM